MAGAHIKGVRTDFVHKPFDKPSVTRCCCAARGLRPRPPRLLLALRQDWDPRVLRNQLCEEVSVMVRGRPRQQQGLAAVAPLPRLPSVTSRQGSVVRRRANALDPASAAPAAATVQLSELLGHLGPASLARLASSDPSVVGRPVLSTAAEQPASLEPAIGQEAVAVSLAAERPSAGGALHKRVLMRGLRIKVRCGFSRAFLLVNNRAKSWEPCLPGGAKAECACSSRVTDIAVKPRLSRVRKKDFGRLRLDLR